LYFYCGPLGLHAFNVSQVRLWFLVKRRGIGISLGLNLGLEVNGKDSKVRRGECEKTKLQVVGESCIREGRGNVFEIWTSGNRKGLGAGVSSPLCLNRNSEGTPIYIEKN